LSIPRCHLMQPVMIAWKESLDMREKVDFGRIMGQDNCKSLDKNNNKTLINRKDS
jgi:hypothetical protein